VTPFAWDQFDNAARVVALGAGMATPAQRLRPRKLARDMEALATSDAIRARCAQLAARFIAPHDPAALCREIEHVVLGGQKTNPVARSQADAVTITPY